MIMIKIMMKILPCEAIQETAVDHTGPFCAGAPTPSPPLARIAQFALIIIVIIIIIIKILLRQLEAVWLQSWPTIPKSKSRFVAFHDPVGLCVITDITSLWPMTRCC